MTAVLPENFIIDAIPEKRTPDERDSEESLTPDDLPSAGNGEEARSTAPAEGEVNQRYCNGKPGRSPQDPSKDFKKSESTGRGRPKSSEKKKSKPTNVFSISNCSGFHFGPAYSIVQNINGYATQSEKSHSEHRSKKESDSNDVENIKKKLSKCFEVVTEEDCVIVSEFVSSSYIDFCREIFYGDAEIMKHYEEELKLKTRTQALRLILTKWRQINGKSADVRLLGKILGALKEQTAIKELAKRHMLL